MATANRWAIGELYNLGYQNGVAGFWTQPGGPGTPVYPTQQNAAPWPEYPIPGLVIQEYSPWFSPGCGHSVKTLECIREWDYDTNMSVALICCNICTYVQRTIEPFEEWLNPIQNAIIIA